MVKIKDITAREILDSKGEPTVEAEVILEDGIKALGQVPSGASTGKNEAVELRDGDPKHFNGKGVLKAVANIKDPIRKLLVGLHVANQVKLDELMIDLDGTENKSCLGANAILGVSMAVCRASARSQNIPLFKYFGQLSDNNKFNLPQPQILILEGGKHGSWSTDIQEYFVIPKKEKFPSFSRMLRAGSEVFQALEKILDEKGWDLGVGYEGAFCPQEIKSNEQAFELMLKAIKNTNYKPGTAIALGADGAASEFFKNGRYILKSEGNLELTEREWSNKIIGWTKKYPFWSLEDMHMEEDWHEWVYLTSQIGEKIQVVGDDLLTTNVKRIKKAIDLKAVSSVIIKPNQIGTITETIKAIKLCHSSGLKTIVSHRAGETNDDFIADLAVGAGCGQCKFGAPNRGERLAKYNRLLKIEEQLIN